MATETASASLLDCLIFMLDCELPLGHRAGSDRGAASLASALVASGIRLRDAEDWNGGRCLLVSWAGRSAPPRVVPEQLDRSLRQANRGRETADRIRVRLAIGASLAHRSPAGLTSHSTISAIQLLDSQALHDSIASSGNDLALIVCDAYFEEAVRGTTQERDYRHVAVGQCHGMPMSAWVWDGKTAKATMPLLIEPSGSIALDSENACRRSWRDFDAFYRANYGIVRNIMNSREQDWTLAEEVTQKAMLIAYRRWDDLREHPNQVGWVVTTARRILTRVAQHQDRRQVPLTLQPPEEAPILTGQTSDAAIERATMSQVINKALSLLPKDQRECIVLYSILDRPVAEIARLLDLSENTVKTRLRSARKSLQEILGEDPRIEGVV